jgi:hypothetical protein
MMSGGGTWCFPCGAVQHSSLTAQRLCICRLLVQIEMPAGGVDYLARLSLHLSRMSLRHHGTFVEARGS